TVYEDQLERHLKKCNQTKKIHVVYYSANINSGISNYEFSPAEKVSLNSVSQEKVTKLIEKVKACCKAHIPKIPEEILSHQVFREELLEMANNATILKHLKQQASLIGHLEQQHLLGPKTTFLEFGAGRGKLSHWLQLAVGNNTTDVNYLLIDRANIRYKASEYQGEDQGPSFQRLNLDIEHLDLSKVPCLKNREQNIVAISKHLCGAATDLTLRCLMETLINSQSTEVSSPSAEDSFVDRGSKRLKIAPSEDSVKGIILALCCHHCCSWPQYVGRPFLQNLGFTAEDFHLLCCLTSWATCGIRAKKRQKGNTGETVDDHTVSGSDNEDWDSDNENGHNTMTEKALVKEGRKNESPDQDSSKAAFHFHCRWSQFTVSEREEIGRQCKRLIDAGRLWYLESRDFSAKLAFYVDSTVSLENAVLIATPRT
ncbi:unnamed protein product, partial [Porites evermanni]